MSGVGNSLSIPSYIVASSPQGLRRLCLLNNLKFGRQFVYKDFQFVNGKWYCWYETALSISEANKEVSPVK